MIGDMNQDRLKHAANVGFTPIDLTQGDNLGDLIAQVVGVPEVDAAIDAVGFEAKGQGKGGEEVPATVLNSLMTVVKAAGGIGIPGPLRHRGSGRQGRRWQDGQLEDAFRSWMGKVAPFLYRSDPLF
jgi:glutathione-independent formaldehyde dehydrogenase